MKTRRKSKVAAADDDAASQATDDGALNLAIPADLDLDALATLLPDVSFNSLTPDGALSLMRLVITQAMVVDNAQRELEECRGEGERKDVELDQALQDRESATRDLESALHAAHAELKTAKQERDKLAVSEKALQAQITSFNTSQATSSTELFTLRRRVEDAEREKRDVVGVVTRLKEDTAQRDEEIQTLRGSLKQSRQDAQALESQVRELRSAETSTKFKIETLTQQLQLAQSEVERTSSELTAKVEEFSKYRRTRHSELAQLQTANDTLTQTQARAESSLKALESAHASQTHQLTQALAQVQDLKGALAEQEATFAAEVGGLKRLVAMMEDREAQQKALVESIESQWAGVGERADRRELALKDEVERERRLREDADKRVEQMQKVLEKMDRGELPALGGGFGSFSPATPMRGGTPEQGMMGLSPTVAMASRAQRSGKTFTEVYADYIKLQEDFARKSLEYDQMERTLTQVLGQIEERAPTLAQQRAEHDRSIAEAAQLASKLAQALSERDGQVAVAHEASQKLRQSQHENALLQQQLEDLGRQVRALLKEVGRVQDPSIPSDDELAQDESTAPAADIEAVITNNLVLFRSIDGLQEQNQKLLRVVREMGAKMEGDEREYRERMELEQNEAVREAMEMIQGLEARMGAQKKSHDVTVQALTKERDMLKGMLARAGSGGAPALSLPNGTGPSAANGDSSYETDSARELAEIRGRYETAQTELGFDAERNRRMLADSQRETGQLNAQLAKAHARMEFLNERHRIANDQYAQKVRELDNLTERHQQLYEQCTRYDIECHRATEELAIVSNQLEQMRNENANLRAEKKIGEAIHARLADENKALALDVSKYSGLVGNVQKMHNDLERSGDNDRRRLEAQIQMMEDQVLDLRTQLSQERDSVRQITMQKDLELRELHNRVDRAVQDLAKARESLVAAETSKQHLEERIQDLHRQLQGNDEKLAVYERRGATVNGVAHHVPSGLNREDQLEAEVAELRSQLKVAEVDLANARSHVQQFQEIAQANEAALASLNSTFDDYKASSESQLARHEAENAALEEKLKTVHQDLTQATQQYAELQSTFEAERAAWMNDKKELEGAIFEMGTSEKHSESDRVMFETEVRQQEERVKSAEERYTREVVAHAESIKALQEVRTQLSGAQTRATESIAAAETAKANLAASETSWKQQKDTLEKELSDLSARCKDLKGQNESLHNHLESVSSQAARIRQAADASAMVTGGDGSDDSDTKTSELQGVVAYLRKENEINELQLELTKVENARIKSHLEAVSRELDEKSARLAEEIDRNKNATISAAQHTENMERINQLTILRESNATLRAECEANARRARDLDAKLQRLTAELEPAKEEARIAKAELGARELQIQRLEAQSRQWQERNSQLLTRYDRIDPAEMQSLKEEIERLKQQKDEADNTANTEKSKHTKLRELALKNQEIFKKRMNDANEKEKTLTTRVAELEGQLATASAGQDELAAGGVVEVKRLSDELEALKEQKAALETALASAQSATLESTIDPDLQATITSLTEERDRLLQERETLMSGAAMEPSGDSEAVKQVWEAEKSELLKARDQAIVQLQAAQEEARKAVNDAKTIRFQNEKFQTRLQDLGKARAADSERSAAEVAAAIQRTKDEMQASGSAVAPDDIVKQHAEDLKALEARLLEKHTRDLEAAVAEAKKQAAQGASTPEFEERLKTEIEAAQERGRVEVGMKLRLKDSQLAKISQRVKELEGQILEWKTAGLVPDDVPASPAKPAAATPKPLPAAKPVAGTSAAAAETPAVAATAPTATRGRGAPRARGVRGAGRGAAPARGGGPAAAAAAAAAASSGLSIAGAAAKRGREEGDAAGDDTLAKRLKPADGAATPKPVTLRRPAA